MRSNRKIYFGAGPAQLPEEVRLQAAEAILDYNNSGLSILEIPHRGKAFCAILEECEQLVRELCQLPEDFSVLWLPGGGRLQFSMVPMNFLNENQVAGFIDSGHWSAEAEKYARYYGKTRIVSSSCKTYYDRLPTWPELTNNQLDYLHLTTNNTIYGTQWKDIPVTSVPLIADMSSDVLSMPRDYSSYSLFYAVAQKNLGAAGVTMVVIRRDLLQRAKQNLPPFLSYLSQVEKNSVVNTPPVFAIFTSLLMLRWIKSKTLTTLFNENKSKASLLYNEVDRNELFTTTVKEKKDRSIMNVCFRGINTGIEEAFSDFCSANNISGMGGHRSVGGFRASLYNAVSLEQVKTLVAALQEFEANCPDPVSRDYK